MSVTLGANSRLRFGDLLLDTETGFEFFDMLELPEVPEQPDDVKHMVQSNDRIDALAYKYYGAAIFWPFIAAANEIFLPPLGMVEGKTLRVPSPRYVLQLFRNRPPR